MIKLTNILNEKVEGGKVICDKCGWEWNVSDGGNEPYTCHKCGNVNEDLRKWFGKGGEGSTTGGGWDRYDSKGKKVGKCGDSKSGSAYAACLSKEKAAKLGPDGRAAFVKRKRAAQSKAGDSKKGGEKSKGQKPTFVKTGASEGLEEKWSAKYKKSINCSNPKGFSQKAHCAGKKKNENMASKLTVEQKMQLFLEKNCPTDPGKWSASKAAAKSKFDVYPSAYANGWAAKNYKSKGGGWKVCKESVMKEVEVGPGHENDRDMVVGVAEILRMVDDMNNRKEIADAMLRKFKSEEVIHNAGEFLTLCGISS